MLIEFFNGKKELDLLMAESGFTTGSKASQKSSSYPRLFQIFSQKLGDGSQLALDATFQRVFPGPLEKPGKCPNRFSWQGAYLAFKEI